MQNNTELNQLFLELYSLNTGWCKGSAHVSRNWAASNQTITRRIKEILKEEGNEAPKDYHVIDQYKHNPAE